MHMAAALVNRLCAPTLLALKQAGLEYLLLDETQARTFRNSAGETGRQPALPGVRTRVPHVPPALRTSRSPAASPEKHGARLPPPEDTPGPEASLAAPDPASWPAAWQERLKKTRIAPVVWTYWELGQDLCGAPDPKRRELLQDLLHDLAHPPGTHCFWPLALPGRDGGGEELEANASAFWEGVRLLRGRAVMVMGSQSLHSLALPDRMLAMRPFQQDRYQGSLLIVLPSPGMLIEESRRILALREFLRHALAPFA
jgi:hypothetical protein